MFDHIFIFIMYCIASIYNKFFFIQILKQTFSKKADTDHFYSKQFQWNMLQTYILIYSYIFQSFDRQKINPFTTFLSCGIFIQTPGQPAMVFISYRWSMCRTFTGRSDKYSIQYASCCFHTNCRFSSHHLIDQHVLSQYLESYEHHSKPMSP